MSIDVDPLFTIREFAEYVGRPLSQVRPWADRRQIPLVKIGGRLFVRRSEADRFLAQTIGTR